MRAALISMTGQPRADEGSASLMLAGKTLARRQLDFALAAGCERILALGNGASAEAIALSHAAESAGASFQAIGNSHGLLGAVSVADELLVLAPGLLPDSAEALAVIGNGKRVLVLPAGAGVAAGFERIDLERAWAGVAVLPGSLVERLAELPPDIEPTSALMRIAMQAGAPERRLADELLADGSWSTLADGADAAASESGWLKRNLAPAPAHFVSKRLAHLALRPLATRLLAAPRSVSALVGTVAVLLAGAVAATRFGWPAIGFALVALGAPLAAVSIALARLRDMPFGRPPRRWSMATILPGLVDAALVGCGILAIDGSWLHRVFSPLVLLGVLHLGRESATMSTALITDRTVLAAFFAVAAAFGRAEPAIMLAALGLIALEMAQSRARFG